MGDHHLIE